ncbi:MAG TPA: VWA domain-containing protein [Mycobacteriales bacterium]|nr:VWA domain-containing protein [Mycobacteriales bacterium]
MSTFLAPGWLWLLLAVAGLTAAYVLLQRRRTKYAVRFTNTALLDKLVPRRPGWRRHLPFALLLLTLGVLTAAMAKPTTQVRVPREQATVIMAIDVSLSMQATDVSPTRIDAAKAAAKEFVQLIPPRINLGLVSFAGTATVSVSPTTDRDAVLRAIDDLQLRESTAIGEAIFSSLDAIRAVAAQTRDANGQPVPAAVVLMSDGDSKQGRSVDEAVAASRGAGVPVSTIAFGTEDGTVDIGGERVAVPADRSTLKEIAQRTGGSYHSAVSAGELQDVYRDLGSQVGYATARREVTAWFVGTALLLGFAAAALSLWWTNRLV